MRSPKELIETEDPAVDVLIHALGWKELDNSTTETMRPSLKDAILLPHLHAAIKRLNPWISPDNEQRVIREVTNILATSAIEANEKLHTILVMGTTVQQDKNDGLCMKSHGVYLIDFEHPEKNEFTVVRQFHAKNYVDCYPDLTLFINGIPIVVIECKSPGIRDPKNEGLAQLLRYQEATDKDRNQGCPQLFNTVQILAVIYRDRAWCATNLSEERHWSEWKEAYPYTLDDLAQKLGRPPTEQAIFLFGVCSKENLLSIRSVPLWSATKD